MAKDSAFPGIGGMDTEEDPEYLGSFSACRDFFQAIVFLVIAKTSLQEACPFFGNGPGRLQFSPGEPLCARYGFYGTGYLITSFTVGSGIVRDR